MKEMLEKSKKNKHLPDLTLSGQIDFYDLYTRDGLLKVHHHFCVWLKEQNILLPKKQMTGDDLIAFAPYLESFILWLFQLDPPPDHVAHAHALRYKVKVDFIRRRVARDGPPQDVSSLSPTVLERFIPTPVCEDLFAKTVAIWLVQPEMYGEEILAATAYTKWALYHPGGQTAHKTGTLFSLPQQQDFSSLIDVDSLEPIRPRSGFSLTDAGISKDLAMDQSHYCIGCHKQEKDVCRVGQKMGDSFKKNPLENILSGCPLDQKISEMACLVRQNSYIAALAVAMIDNPMIPGTGHRICNDCAKACIFQKQTPVDIPGMETQIVKEVLAKPWGFEIYSLLTCWNPLNYENSLPAPVSDYNILVAGMGPAGYTLSHYLMQQGHNVVGIDGTKIEPLDSDLAGFDVSGAPCFKPIYDIQDIFSDLATRSIDGFGGVAEYGITVRWDKNLLKVIYLALSRRRQLKIYGGVRLGSTLTLSQALQEYGFDHVALCTGAGRPHIPNIKNMMAPGVRQASDFLMALQLTGAAQKNSVSSLLVQLPIVVIGAGLTGIDSATEALAYYPLQVLKFQKIYRELVRAYGVDYVRADWSQHDTQIADIFLAHADALMHAKTPIERLNLLKSWGGCRVLYRKSIEHANSYRLNHLELEKALEEGVVFTPDFQPTEVILDKEGWAVGVRSAKGPIVPARTVLIATGTVPNTALSYDAPELSLDSGTFQIQEEFFTPVDGAVGQVSVLGDAHPRYYGSVVKAMASAKKAAPSINRWLWGNAPKKNQALPSMLENFKSFIISCQQEQDHAVIKVCAPAVASNYKPGHFFRMQGYTSEGIVSEGIPVSPISLEGDIITFWLKNKGGSRVRLLKLKPGMPVLLMGPSGCPVPLPQRKIILFVAPKNTYGIHSIIAGLRTSGNTVHHLDEVDDVRNFSFEGMNHVYGMGPPDFLLKINKYIPTHIPYTLQVPSPMQCMMKEICAQCVQQIKDPKTGEKNFIFACAQPWQKGTCVDLDVAQGRLQQNSLQEKIYSLWSQGV